MEKEFKELDLVVFLEGNEVVYGEVLSVAPYSLVIVGVDGSRKRYIQRKDVVFHSIAELWSEFDYAAKDVYEFEKEQEERRKQDYKPHD